MTYCTQQMKPALHKKMRFSITDFFSKCDQIRRKLRETADLVTFTEEIRNGKSYFLCSADGSICMLLFCCRDRRDMVDGHC